MSVEERRKLAHQCVTDVLSRVEDVRAGVKKAPPAADEAAETRASAAGVRRLAADGGQPTRGSPDPRYASEDDPDDDAAAEEQERRATYKHLFATLSADEIRRLVEDPLPYDDAVEKPVTTASVGQPTSPSDSLPGPRGSASASSAVGVADIADHQNIDDAAKAAYQNLVANSRGDGVGDAARCQALELQTVAGPTNVSIDELLSLPFGERAVTLMRLGLAGPLPDGLQALHAATREESGLTEAEWWSIAEAGRGDVDDEELAAAEQRRRALQLKRQKAKEKKKRQKANRAARRDAAPEGAREEVPQPTAAEVGALLGGVPVVQSRAEVKAMVEAAAKAQRRSPAERQRAGALRAARRDAPAEGARDGPPHPTAAEVVAIVEGVLDGIGPSVGAAAAPGGRAARARRELCRPVVKDMLDVALKQSQDKQSEGWSYQGAEAAAQRRGRTGPTEASVFEFMPEDEVEPFLIATNFHLFRTFKELCPLKDVDDAVEEIIDFARARGLCYYTLYMVFRASLWWTTDDIMELSLEHRRLLDVLSASLKFAAHREALRDLPVFPREFIAQKTEEKELSKYVGDLRSIGRSRDVDVERLERVGLVMFNLAVVCLRREDVLPLCLRYEDEREAMRDREKDAEAKSYELWHEDNALYRVIVAETPAIQTYLAEVRHAGKELPFGIDERLRKKLPRRRCDVCEVLGPIAKEAFPLCDGCGARRYCDVGCQEIDWRRGHSQVCSWDGK